MTQIGVVIALVFSLIIAIFAILNNQLVSINYLFGKVEVSTVIIILGAAFSGALVVFLLGIIRQIKLSVKIKGLNADIRDLEKDLNILSDENDNLKSRLYDYENKEEETTLKSYEQQVSEKGIYNDDKNDKDIDI